MRRRKFAEEMTTSGMVAAIRAEAGNLRYEYYQPLDDAETILLIDSWTDQAAIDGGQPEGRNTLFVVENCEAEILQETREIR